MHDSIQLQYSADGLATAHNSEFLADRRFQDAYRFGMQVGALRRIELHIEWRAWIAIWAAEQALLVPGDFVECGVHTGILSGTVMHWTNFRAIAGRTFWLLDTFNGLPEDQLSESERKIGLQGYNTGYRAGDALADINAKFRGFPNVRIVPGAVPETLAKVEAERVAYLSIDMNMALPEIAAAEHFWPKLSPGGIILLDDYNWVPHINQKRAFDAFAAARGLRVLGLPTGQGIIVKPP
ncbi:MAG: class I SAM-dependent methyltransferase [Alphaproteobacteria bacterium]|nr:class I SAM-dependent methyltransferase [Alphaproteobacteria bacterium]